METQTVTRTKIRWVDAEGSHEAREHHSRSALGKHTYRADGLLEVNPDGAHPIFELVKDARERWNAKLGRASRTLDQAVWEYKRRYKRAPPRGFDDWWAYVKKHGVQLPDEYDQIYRDLEPFWGMNPKDLQRIQAEWEAHADSYTIGKAEAGPIAIVNYSLPGMKPDSFDLRDGAYQIMDLLKEVEDKIPPFRAIFSPHDNPNLPLDWELREQAIKHAAAGTFLDINDPPPVKLDGWVSSCSPTSTAVRNPPDLDAPAPSPTTKTFIHTHRLAMDPCLHPSLLLLHGQFLSHNKGPVPHRFMPPQFSYSQTTLHHDITPAMPINWVEDLAEDWNPVWEERRDERLLWRGTNTGMWHAHETRWREAQRARTVSWAADPGDGSGDRKVLKPGKENQRVGEGDVVKWARWAPAILDVAFAGSPGSCAPGTCEELEKIFEWRRPVDLIAAGRYKYVLDIDGNGWSSRFKRLITSNALVFKSTVYPEWFTDRVAPWVHYIPVQVDLSDLADSLTFFRGDPNGDGAHDDLAKEIASAGREWSLRFWRREDLTAYMFRLFLEYARVMSTDRLDMSLRGKGYHSLKLNYHTVSFALEYILETHSAAAIFPALKKLHCKVDWYLAQSSIMDLLHPGVTDFYINYSCQSSQFQLSAPVEQFFGLISFEIGPDILRNDLTGLSALHALPRLATVVLYRYTATYPVLEVLSRFPALKVIRTNDLWVAAPSCRGHYPPPCTFEDGSFRQLTVLTLSGCSHKISEILDDKHFPFNIECLIIESVRCMVDPAPAPVYPKMVAKVPTVTNFELCETMEDVSSPFASLRPFLSYNLTELRVKTYLALAYSAAEIEELVHALPIIEVLSLDPYTSLLVPRNGTFTFNHLLMFARHCPRLTYLGILLDTSYPCEAPLDGIVPFPVLKELDLGGSFETMSLDDGAAASLLALVLPNACKLTFDTPFHSPSDSVLSKFLTDFARNRTARSLRKL
ncbi:hypothetical protein C0992_004826 [Termitomyces sp. T32_za158]|nr:hypothetical protein C0992_004826 [Termitomyces sp. T32_za158]